MAGYGRQFGNELESACRHFGVTVSELIRKRSYKIIRDEVFARYSAPQDIATNILYEMYYGKDDGLDRAILIATVHFMESTCGNLVTNVDKADCIQAFRELLGDQDCNYDKISKAITQWWP